MPKATKSPRRYLPIQPAGPLRFPSFLELPDVDVKMVNHPRDPLRNARTVPIAGRGMEEQIKSQFRPDQGHEGSGDEQNSMDAYSYRCAHTISVCGTLRECSPDLGAALL